MIKLKSLLIEGEKEYPELSRFKDTFSAPTLPESSNIGEWVKFNNWNSKMGIHALLPYKIMHLQKLYDGSIGYRLENPINRVGTPVKFNNVTIISKEIAKKLWIENIERVANKYIEFKESW